jgi:hypothetical protein
VDIGTGRNPDSVETSVAKHLIIVAVDLNTEVLVLFIVRCPFNLILVGGTYSHYTSAGDAIHQSVDMAFALEMLENVASLYPMI